MEISHKPHLLQLFIQVLMNALKMLYHEVSSTATQPLLATFNGIEFAGWEEDEDSDDADNDDDDFDDDEDDWYSDDDNDFDDEDEEDDEEF